MAVVTAMSTSLHATGYVHHTSGTLGGDYSVDYNNVGWM